MFAVPRQVTYADLGGIEGVLSDIRELIEHPLQHPEVSNHPVFHLLDTTLYALHHMQ